MSASFGFTQEDTYELAARSEDGDTSGIVSWVEAHVRSHRDMHALFEFLGHAIYAIWPLALTKGANLADGDYWAMSTGPTANAASVTATQMITTSLNADWDTLTPLIHATLSKDEEFHGSVVVYLLVAFGDGLRAVTQSTDPSADHEKGSM